MRIVLYHYFPKKIIELHLATSKPGDKGSKALQALCSNPNPDNLILAILPKIDKSAEKVNG